MKPESSRIFYGWWLVAAASVLALYVGGGIYYSFTAIFEPIVKEFGWSYAQVSVAASVRGMEAGLLAPLFGFLVDRWGPRRLIFGGVLFASGGLFLLSRINSLFEFYTAFFIISIGATSCTTTVLFSTLVHWFRKRLGLASGILISGYASGGILVPLVTTATDFYGWRTAIFLMAIGLAAICLPLSLVLRHKPGPYGYLADGEHKALNADTAAQTVTPYETSFTLGQALRGSAFWHLLFASAYLIATLNLVMTHVMPYLSSIGVSRALAGLIATAIPLASVLGRIGFGWMADRVNRRRAAATGFAMMGLGLVCFTYLSGIGMWLTIPFLVLFGCGYGGVQVMRLTLVREYFGPASFGRVFGTMDGMVMVLALVGPPLGGWVYDTWGVYQPILLILGGFSSLAIISLLTLGPVSKGHEISVRPVASRE